MRERVTVCLLLGRKADAVRCKYHRGVALKQGIYWVIGSNVSSLRPYAVPSPLRSSSPSARASEHPTGCCIALPMCDMGSFVSWRVVGWQSKVTVGVLRAMVARKSGHYEGPCPSRSTDDVSLIWQRKPSNKRLRETDQVRLRGSSFPVSFGIAQRTTMRGVHFDCSSLLPLRRALPAWHSELLCILLCNARKIYGLRHLLVQLPM